jgi:hypothetical protein
MIGPGEFRETLQAPVLLTFYDYWQRLRGERAMPTWSDLKPEEMPSVLPYIWAWRVIEAENIRLRLMGETIYQAMTRTVRDKTPEDLYPAATAAEIRGRLLRVVRTPAGSGTIGRVLYDGEEIGTGERLALPYSDGRGGIGVIGVSILHPATDPVTGEPRPINPKAFFVLVGTETWLRLPAHVAAG